MAITYQQAVQFMNGPVGSQIPRVARLLRPSNWNNLNKANKNYALNEIERAINDPVGFSLDRLKKDVADYVIYQNLPGGGGTAKAEAKDLKANIDKYVPYLQQNGVSINDIMSTIDKGYLTGAESLQEQVGRMNKTSTIDKVADVALNIGLGVATGGLSLSQQIIANALLQLGSGANPSDIVRNVAATVAANSLTNGIPGIEASKAIPNQLNKLNVAIAELAPGVIQPTAISALINAERQAVAAAITKQDIVQNAIAGAAGGTIADLTGRGLKAASPTMSNALTQALSRATAEYAQYKTAGFSDEEALTKAITGYVAQSQKIEADAAKAEAAAAKEKKDTAGLSTEQVGIAKAYLPAGQAGQFTGTEGRNLPPVEVTAGTDPSAQPESLSIVPGSRPYSATDVRAGNVKSLPPVTVTAQADVSAPPEDISVAATQAAAEKEAQPKEQTPEQQRRDMILTSLINRNVSKPLYSNRAKTVTQQAGTPGTAALSQALRVGDIGAPIFGRDEEGRKAGWNLQSLRYMGDVGAEK